MKTKEEINKAAEKNWELTNSQMKDGVNPYAYLIGFKDAVKWVESIKPTVSEAGRVAAKISELMESKDQAMFIAGFEECIKWQKLNEEK